MTPVYVRNLIELLKFLGWEQQAIAKRLKVSTTAVSLWATGKRPVSKRHVKPFLELVSETLHADYAAIHQESTALAVGANTVPREEQERRLDRSQQLDNHVRQISGYLHAWDLEMYVAVGKFTEAVKYELEVLMSPYAQMDPLKLSRDERRKLRFACQMLVRHFDYLDQLDMPSPQGNITADWTPTAHFEATRLGYGMTEEEE